MARKKKTEPIVGLGNHENKLMVQKSLPLFSLWQSNLTLAEFKILDTYLSRIDSHNPEKRTVVFNKGELEKILGVDRIRTADLKERLKHLMEHVVELPNPELKRGFWLISLFERAVAEQDDDDFWEIKMTCSKDAMRYIFNIENLGYLRYKLKTIFNITSRYSYIMFCYLEHNRFRKSWEVELNELKKILNCHKEASYNNSFKYFNDKILKKVQKELCEKTDCKFDYETVKKGRYVVAIRFTVHSLAHLEVVEEEQEDSKIIDLNEDQYTITDKIDNKSYRENICADFSQEIFDDFSDEELQVLKKLSWFKIDENILEIHKKNLDDSLLAHEFAVSDFLEKKILLAKSKKPKNLFAYVKKIIENS